MAFDDTPEEGDGDGGGGRYDRHNPPNELIERYIASIDTSMELQGYCGVCGVRELSVAGMAKVAGSLAAKSVITGQQSNMIDAIKYSMDEMFRKIAAMSIDEYERHYVAYEEQENGEG